MLEYKGFKISGTSTPIYMERMRVAWLCFQIRPSRFKVIEVARIEAKIFKTMKEAEAHGLVLARDWGVDRQLKRLIQSNQI